jgi:hypothetical protein
MSGVRYCIPELVILDRAAARHASREVKGAGCPAVASVAELLTPTIPVWKSDDPACPRARRRRARGGVECVDRPITKIADRQRIAERSDISRRDRQSPRQIQRTRQNQPLQAAFRSSRKHPRSRCPVGHVVVLLVVLHGVRNVELASQIVDIERSESAPCVVTCAKFVSNTSTFRELKLAA